MTTIPSAPNSTPPVPTGDARRPRIVHLIDHLGWGGAERLLLQYLPYLRDAGFDVRVCAMEEREGNPVAQQIEELGFPVDMVHVPLLRDLSAVPRLVRYLKSVDADLVHTQLEFADALGTLAARIRRIPSVSTLHTMYMPDKGTRAYYRNRLGDLIIGHLSRTIICVSDGARQHYIDHKQYPARVLRTIRNGIDVSAYPGDADAGRGVLDGLGVPRDAVVVVSVAVLRAPKGLDRAIAAVADLADTHPHLHHVIVGDGDHRHALEAAVDRHGVRDRVHFAGARTDVPDILAACHVFVHPTLEDALPTVLAEAGAAGLPIVASDVGGVPEMVLQGRNGLLVPPDDVPALRDAIGRMLDHADERERMGAQAREVARERFDIATQAGVVANLYRILIGGGR